MLGSMTNIYRGFGGSGSGGSGSGGSGSGGSGSGGWLRRGSGPAGGGRRRWAAALAITAVVIGGGAFAAAEAATGSPAAPATLTAAGPQTSTTGQSSASASAAAKKAWRHGRLARLRHLGGMYGQATFETKTGPRTLAFERGTIASVSGNDVVIRAHNGVTEAWRLTSTSVVRENGQRTTDSALAAGQLVFAGGPVTGGAHDVRLIVIRKTASSTGA
jgi:hypothetical protein